MIVQLTTHTLRDCLQRQRQNLDDELGGSQSCLSVQKTSDLRQAFVVKLSGTQA
jgi:hypothetical protein